MNLNKKTGRILGILFFLVMVFWYLGFAILNPILNDPNYLELIYAQQTKVLTGVLFELLEVSLVMGIAFILFRILKIHSDSLAISYVGFRIFESIMLVIALMCPLILITLSYEYIENSTSDLQYYELLGIIFKEIRQDWSLYVLALFHPLAAMPMYYFFFRTKLVPRFLSVWGFLAAFWLLLDQVILESFGLGFGRISGNPISGIPMGANEVVLGIWLIIKGFDKSRLNALIKSNVE